MSALRVTVIAIVGFVAVCLVAIGLIVLFIFSARTSGSSQTTVPVSQVISLVGDGRVQEIRPEGSGYIAILNDGTEYRFNVANEDNLLGLLQDAGVSQPELIIRSN